MKKVLIVVDMQKDFVDGALGSKEAAAIVDNVVKKIEGFDGRVIFTRDTHEEDYLSSQEGKNLPVEHCIGDTAGWQISAELSPFCKEVVDKPTFGSVELAKMLCDIDSAEGIESITFIGLCTDICVISNAMLLKAAFPEVDISVDSSACAGVSAESHGKALDAMRMVQIEVN